MSEVKLVNWEHLAVKHLVGRKIVKARYMTEEEAENSGFYSRPIVLVFDDGNWICPMADDEGNDAGALHTSYENYHTAPVL